VSSRATWHARLDGAFGRSNDLFAAYGHGKRCFSSTKFNLARRDFGFHRLVQQVVTASVGLTNVLGGGIAVDQKGGDMECIAGPLDRLDARL
jgi:hypothetical protein